MNVADLNLKWEAHEIIAGQEGSRIRRAFINPSPVTDDPTAIEFSLPKGKHAVIVNLGPERKNAFAVIDLSSEVERRYRVGFQQKRGRITVVTWDISDTTIGPTLVATMTAAPPSEYRSTVRRSAVANEAEAVRPAEYTPPPSPLFPPR